MPTGHRFGAIPLNQLPPSYPTPVKSESAFDPGYGWFCFAPLYALIPLTRSVVSLYEAEAKKPVRMLNIVTDRPVMGVSGVDTSKNPWFYTLQGIEPEHADMLRYFIESSLFKTPGTDFRIRVERCRSRVGAHVFDLHVALPESKRASFRLQPQLLNQIPIAEVYR